MKKPALLLAAVILSAGFQALRCKEPKVEAVAAVSGVEETGKAYKHIVNTGNYHGVYMTRSERATGFIDILGPEDGFCKGELTSVRTRVVNKAGKPVVMGTCFTPPVDGVLRQDWNGCAFRIHLMRDADSGDALAYLTIDSGDCSAVGSGGADLASIAGVGFWMLK
ncbi:MAG: hypothetical protein HY926_03850 [Elusimicrobia bacterium]|nr:hypothetical protein [Elusimicrobiota bacterium]